MGKWHYGEISLNHRSEAVAVPIVRDGIVGTAGIADGRLVPVLIVDTATRPDIDQVVIAHRVNRIGDVESSWYRPSRWRKDVVGVILKFKAPVPCVVLLDFNLNRQAVLVDQIIRVQGFYLQPGRPGDQLKDTIQNDRVLIEVPSQEMHDQWEDLFHWATERRLRKSGLSKRRARVKAMELIQSWRELGAKRVPHHGFRPPPSKNSDISGPGGD